MDYSAANTTLWAPIMQFGLIAVALLVSYGLCRVIPGLRKSLIPAGVIAGFLLLLLKVIGVIQIDTDFMEMLTYHGIAIGFIALTLRVPDAATSESKLTGVKSGAVIVGSYMVQGIAGLAITITLALTIMPDLFEAAGILLPMSFGQGPGQANNIGSTFEGKGFEGGRSFGIALAAAGYLVACIVGVIYVNVLAKRGKIKKVDPEYVSGNLSVNDFQQKDEVPVGESDDRLSIQLVLVFVVYLITYLATWGITSGLSAISESLGDTLNSLLWGFNFIIGAGFALLTRVILKKLKNKNIMKRQYQNNYLLSRISGFFFDIMVVSALCSIEISDLSGLWLPFILLVIAGAVVTLLHLRFVCKRVYPDYYYEGLLSMYGMMTGTISSGVLLLREVDPLMKTPAANNLVIGSTYGILFGIPVLALVAIAPNSMTMCIVTLLICVVYYLILLRIIFIKGKGKKAVAADAEASAGDASAGEGAAVIDASATPDDGE